jgi:tripartite-type tricarboxylate transporter receptor subunit TctC
VAFRLRHLTLAFQHGNIARMRIAALPRRFYSVVIAAFFAAAAAGAVAQAPASPEKGAGSPGQAYPSRPIRIIAAQTAGGATDIFARMIGQKLAEAWKQPVVVENRPGAAGTIGTEITVRAPADGYTLLLATAGQIVIHQSLYPKLAYDPIRDLAPITFVAASPLVLVVHPSVPAQSIKALVTLAKSHPDRLNHGSGGSGSPAHLAAELFKSMAGIRMTHIPFKGVAPAVAAVVAGQIDLTFATVAATLPQVKANRLRALAVTTPKRSQIAPDIPTVAEAGVSGYEVTTWYGMFGPAALPKEIVSKLNAEITRILRLAEIRERLFNDGAETANLPPAQFTAFINADAARWAKLIKAVGITAD